MLGRDRRWECGFKEGQRVIRFLYDKVSGMLLFDIKCDRKRGKGKKLKGSEEVKGAC